MLFAGSHEATALAVANQQVDVATNNSETLKSLEESDPETRSKIEVIWTSPLIPTAPIAYRNDLPDCLKTEIRNFFYTYSDRDVLTPLGWAGFVPAEDKDWNSIRELDIGKQMLDLQNNEQLDDDIRREQLEQLQKQLNALQSEQTAINE